MQILASEAEDELCPYSNMKFLFILLKTLHFGQSSTSYYIASMQNLMVTIITGYEIPVIVKLVTTIIICKLFVYLPSFLTLFGNGLKNVNLQRIR
jgi:hypothetical protein